MVQHVTYRSPYTEYFNQALIFEMVFIILVLEFMLVLFYDNKMF